MLASTWPLLRSKLCYIFLQDYVSPNNWLWVHCKMILMKEKLSQRIDYFWKGLNQKKLRVFIFNITFPHDTFKGTKNASFSVYTKILWQERKGESRFIFNFILVGKLPDEMRIQILRLHHTHPERTINRVNPWTPHELATEVITNPLN